MPEQRRKEKEKDADLPGPNEGKTESVDDEKMDLVQRWLFYLVKELNAVKDIEARTQLTGLCIMTLAQETKTCEHSTNHGRPSYIG